MTDTTTQAPVRAYLIDPGKRSIEEVTLTQRPTPLYEIYKLLDCTTITAVSLNDTDAIYCDDEGLLHGPVHQFFSFKGLEQPIAGKGLVIGIDDDGNDASPRQSLHTVRKQLFFIEHLLRDAWSIAPATRPDAMRIVRLAEVGATMAAEA